MSGDGLWFLGSSFYPFSLLIDKHLRSNVESPVQRSFKLTHDVAIHTTRHDVTLMPSVSVWGFILAVHIACACSLTPSARATFSTVAKLGLPSSLSARYRLLRLRPASRAT